ncbi:MAG: LacI family DNA-binding transcriptional regulator, partial [Clostridia bacterium]|nr:LacI family DNA-binding transcriptional regulator [Clostridia bacterium]
MKIYTIKDIAQKAGVSVTTVSRVLNHRPDVNQAT